MKRKTELIEIRFDNISIGRVSLGEILGTIFTPFVPILNIMSDDALITLIEQALELLSEFDLDQRLSRVIRSGSKITEKFERLVATTFIVNTVLASEGMPLLRGFGYYNYDGDKGHKKIKGSTGINPEVTSLRQLPY